MTFIDDSSHVKFFLGEEVAAYVKLTEEASSSSSISVDEVLEYAKTGLARFKVPKYLKFTGIFYKKLKI